jgi:hypothetical protein
VSYLWQLARSAIEKANAVVFVGFRFPPSDAIARERLLAAISKNKSRLRVHTVLGPDRDSATGRLEALLTHALRRGGRMTYAESTMVTIDRLLSITVHPLYAEDFLGLVGRNEILG